MSYTHKGVAADECRLFQSQEDFGKTRSSNTITVALCGNRIAYGPCDLFARLSMWYICKGVATDTKLSSRAEISPVL